MSGLGDKYFKSHTGRAFDEYGTIASTDHTFDNLLKKARTKFRKQLVPLGWGDGRGRVFLTQEDRASHMHVLGATQEGKSKLIELLIRSDINNGYGATLIDPSIYGSTVYKVLNYCASIGFEKVCLIDPSDFRKFDRIPVIQPFKFNAPHEVTVGNLMDALQVVWAVKDRAMTPRIERYVPAVIYALMASGLNLNDVRYLLNRTEFAEQAVAIIQNPSLDRTQAGHLREAFRTIGTFEQFQSTVNRLNDFNDYLLKLVFGSSREGLNWRKLLSELWLILVNLYPKPVWGEDALKQRILGTMFISELIYQIGRLEEHGWRHAHYLYVDEAGDYATRKIARILNLYGKTSLRLVLAHQRFSQFEDPMVLHSIRQNAKIKVLFNSPDTVDREIMMKDMGYGGDIPDRQVSHVLRQLERGQAAVAIGKSSPRLVRFLRIDDVKVKPAKLQALKETIYSQEGYYTEEQINHDINARTPKPESPPTTNSPKQHARGAAKKAARPGPVSAVQGRPPDGGADSENRQQPAKKVRAPSVFRQGRRPAKAGEP